MATVEAVDRGRVVCRQHGSSNSSSRAGQNIRQLVLTCSALTGAHRQQAACTGNAATAQAVQFVMQKLRCSTTASTCSSAVSCMLLQTAGCPWLGQSRVAHRRGTLPSGVRVAQGQGRSWPCKYECENAKQVARLFRKHGAMKPDPTEAGSTTRIRTHMQYQMTLRRDIHAV
jgi:hypothetical protein